MARIAFLTVFFIILINATPNADELHYGKSGLIQETIAQETQEISSADPLDHDGLAQLYVSRGESYLLDSQYDKAIEDFQVATFHIGFCRDLELAIFVAFRASFGEVISYDNLGMKEQTEQALEQLKTMAAHVCCDECAEQRPCTDIIVPSANRLHYRDFVRPSNSPVHFRDMITQCKKKDHSKKENNGENQQSEQSNQNNYSDILGPNEPPSPGWCEEVITGVGRMMDAIACLAPNYAVKVALIGIIEALISRGVKCCQAGGFWKACVAPIARKWKDWKDKKENNILPNNQTLPLYTN